MIDAETRQRLKRAVDRAARARLSREGSYVRRTRAESFLLVTLADGPRPLSDVRADAKEAGLGRDRLERAKRSIGVETVYDRNGRTWTWRLPRTREVE